MNGGNPQRGQADGFALDILPKLNDINDRYYDINNSNNNSMTLLHYIVRTSILKFDGKKGTSEARIPVPEPGDIDKCGHINFEECLEECKTLQMNITKMEKLSRKIVDASAAVHVDPFKEKMTKFLSNAHVQIKDLHDLVDECSNKFMDTKRYYKFTPKDPRKCQPIDFFSLWLPFCQKYKQLWKKEQAKITKEIAQKARTIERKNSVIEKRNSIRERNSLIKILVTPRRSEGFKDRIEKSKVKERRGSKSCHAKRRITFGTVSKEESEIFTAMSEHFAGMYLNNN